VADRTDLTPAADDGGAGDQAAGGQPAGGASGDQPVGDQPVGDQPAGEATGGQPIDEAAGPGAERWLDPAEMKAWLAFLEVSHLLERAIEQQLRQDAGLSHAQYEILSRLEAAAGGRLRMSELADVIVVSRSGLTYQISQLEKAGLVRREKCPSDERGILAILTAAGRDALTRGAPGHLRVVRENLIDALTPAQREAMAEGLSAARTRLRPGH